MKLKKVKDIEFINKLYADNCKYLKNGYTELK